jgi:hypothetical protein
MRRNQLAKSIVVHGTRSGTDVVRTLYERGTRGTGCGTMRYVTTSGTRSGDP